MTPNSLMLSFAMSGDDPLGGVADELATMRLALRFVSLPLSVGEFAAEDRPEIRGILVGVSFGYPEDINEVDGGGSFDD